MSRWGLFFLLTPVACVAVFAAAEFIGWSLPPNYSTIGAKIDHLYYLLLAITGVVFLFTEFGLAFLVYFYARPSDDAERQGGRSTFSIAAWLLVPLVGFVVLVALFPMPPLLRLGLGGSLAVGWLFVMALLLAGRRAATDRRAVYSHGNTSLEVVWTLVPAAIIVFITFYQMPVWAELRYPRERPDGVVPVRVIGRQFEWRMVYPGPDGKLDTPDDLHVPNELHVAKGEEVWIDLRSMDVVHSFFLPMHRIKQDAVPGLSIPVWFDCKASTWEHQAKDASFHSREVTDLPGFVGAVSAAGTPVFEQLKARLAEPLKDASKDRLPPVDKVVAGLNNVMDSADLMAAGRFQVEALPFDLRKLAESKPTGANRRLLNRKLLDLALSPYIRPLDRNFDIVCTELCGWGHYKMKGRLIVHETREDLNAWLDEQTRLQEAVR